MNVVGLDLSINQSGVCSGTTTVAVKAGTTTGAPRLARMRNGIMPLTLGADLAVIEDYAAHSPGSEARKAELHGVILLGLHDAGIPTALVNPLTLKKYATGKGSGKKDEMKLAAYKQFGHEFGTSDECDAFFLAIMGAEAYGTVLVRDHDTALMVSKRAEAIAKVDWPEVTIES